MTPYQLHEAIRRAQESVEQAEDKYLRAMGWDITCQTHGAYWLWQKTFGDGRHYCCGRDLAVSLQRASDYLEQGKDHEPVDDGEGFCTICGGEVREHGRE